MICFLSAFGASQLAAKSSYGVPETKDPPSRELKEPLLNSKEQKHHNSGMLDNIMIWAEVILVQVDRPPARCPWWFRKLLTSLARPAACDLSSTSPIESVDFSLQSKPAKATKKRLVVYSDLWDWMKRIESIERNRLTWCKYVQIRESTTWITKQFSCIQDGLQSSWLVGGTNASSLQLCMSLWGSHVKMFDITYKREWLQVQFENM